MARKRSKLPPEALARLVQYGCERCGARGQSSDERHLIWESQSLQPFLLCPLGESFGDCPHLAAAKRRALNNPGPTGGQT
jgi:hypothetical protein